MKLLIKDNKAQGSAELILLMGAILIIVLIVGIYITNITRSISWQIKEIITNGRNFMINKI